MSAEDGVGGDARVHSPPTAMTATGERESALCEREVAVTAREKAVAAREVSNELMEAAASLHVEVQRLRGHIDDVQSEIERLRLSNSDKASGELASLLARVREANEHLVVASVRSQTLADTAEDTNRRQEEFLATLAHELRNPLAPIRSAAALLRLLSHTEPRLEYIGGVIDRQVGYMSRLLDDLLDLARVTTGKIALEKRLVTVSELVTMAVETCRPFLDQRAQRLTVTVPTQPLYVDGDPLRLAQVFSNLLNNAAKYSPEGERITLSAKVVADTVLVRVTDHGSGISEAAIPHIFDLFNQGKRVDGAGGGLGIGLTVARQMVEMHGGTVEAYSDGVGHGAEFTVRLPLVPNVLPARVVAGATRQAVGPDTYRIALIDDNVDANNTLEMLLQMLGHRVSCAFDGSTGIALVQADRPQAVVCDISLPDMDGYEVAARLRGEMKNSLPVLIALTGYGRETDRVRALEAGFDDHVVKPVDADVLLAVIALHVKRREASAPPPSEAA